MKDHLIQGDDRAVHPAAVVGHLLCFSLVGGSLWLAAIRTWHAVKARQQRPATQEDALAYEQKRRQLSQWRLNRAIQLTSSVALVSAMTYVHVILHPQHLNTGHVIGMLFGYFTVAVVGWSTTVAVVPYFEVMVIEYSPIITLAIFCTQVLLFNYCHNLGVTNMTSYYTVLICYNLSWLVEDLPLQTFLPAMASASLLHMVNHLGGQPALWGEPMRMLGAASVYTGLGVVLPALASTAQQHNIKLPSFFHGAVGMVCQGMLVLDVLLRTRKLVEPLQDLVPSSTFASALLGVLMEAPLPGHKYSYGLPAGTVLSTVIGIASLMVLSMVILAVAEDDIVDPYELVPRAKPQDAQTPLLFMLVGFLRGLTTGKKYAVCCIVCVSVLQLLGILNILVKLAMYGADSFITTAPTLLLCIMLGVIVEVVGVLYILMPGGSPGSLNDEVLSCRSMESTPSRSAYAMAQVGRAKFLGGSRSGIPSSETTTSATRSNTYTRGVFAGPPSGGASSNFASSVWSGPGPGSGPHAVTQHETNSQSDDPLDFHVRIEALANFKTFMQGLDQQPGSYSLDDFIKGAANAVKGIFPGVHHASFCLLNSSRTSVNMYTFLGEGALKPPRINVVVAPGTLIFYVLHNCQPIFISNIASFPGPYSDVQFMRFVLGLRSVACLPLVITNSRVLGVLRLGFESTWNWEEHEKSLAKQLALVLSSSSQSIGRPAAPSMPLTSEVLTQLVAPEGQAWQSIGSDVDSQAMLATGYAAGIVGSPMGGIEILGSPGVSRAGSMIHAPMAGVAGQSAAVSAMRLPHQGTLSGTGPPAGTAAHANQPLRSGRLQQVAFPTGHPAGQTLPIRRSFDTYRTPGGNTAGPAFERMQSVAAGTRSATHAYDSDNVSAVWDDERYSTISGSTTASGLRFQNVQAPSTDLKMLEVVGRGGFGSVYKAFWRGTIVAVKVLEHGEEFIGCADDNRSKGELDTGGRRAALLEGAMTSTINHENVVQTYDYRVVHLSPQLMNGPGLPTSRVLQETHIIMEYCDRGSLQDAMEQGVFNQEQAGGRGALDMEMLVLTLHEVSRAMEYLHLHRITHRDLKPKNILLKSSTADRRGFTAKVSDFGLSQVLPEQSRTHVSTKYSGTVTHMSPELIEDGKVYQQGDVYAYGIIMWELFTGASPYPNMAHPQIMVAVVTHNLRPKFPDGCPEWYKVLACKCWRKDPKSRPPFSEIASYLHQLLQDRSWSAQGDVTHKQADLTEEDAEVSRPAS